MTRLGRAALMLAMGAGLGRLVLSGGFGWFVQQNMRWPLVLTVLLLLLFGLYEVIGHADAEAQAAGPAVGWFLVLPFFALIAVAPTALGASAALRFEPYQPGAPVGGFAELERGRQLEMSLAEFLERAVWDEARSLEGVAVQLEGFVVNDPAVSDGFRLTRFLVSCCAADGVPLQVILRDAATYEDDRWISAEVMWRPLDIDDNNVDEGRLVEADVVSITPLDRPPDNPYESP